MNNSVSAMFQCNTPPPPFHHTTGLFYFRTANLSQITTTFPQQSPPPPPPLHTRGQSIELKTPLRCAVVPLCIAALGLFTKGCGKKRVDMDCLVIWKILSQSITARVMLSPPPPHHSILRWQDRVLHKHMLPMMKQQVTYRNPVVFPSQNPQ